MLILMNPHILPAGRERVQAGHYISTLTVRLQGALRLHKFTYQIGTPQSPLLDLPHVSPLHVNNKAVMVTRIGAPCYTMLRNNNCSNHTWNMLEMC